MAVSHHSPQVANEQALGPLTCAKQDQNFYKKGIAADQSTSGTEGHANQALCCHFCADFCSPTSLPPKRSQIGGLLSEV